MKTYRIELKKQAVKFIQTCNPKEQKRLLLNIYQLPDGTNIKKMEGYDHRYRLRVGDTCIIYDKTDDFINFCF